MPKMRLSVVASLTAATLFGALLAPGVSVKGLAAQGRSGLADVELQQSGSPDVASAYNTFLAGEGGRDVRLALWRARHTKFNYHTGIAVTNVGSEPADVRISLEGSDGSPIVGCGPPCSATVASGGSYYWWPGELPGVPNDYRTAWGTAVITGTQPIVAVVHDVSAAKDPSLHADAGAYRGITAAVWNDTSGMATYVPLMLFDHRWPLLNELAASTSLEARAQGVSGAGESGISVLNRDLRWPAQLEWQLFPQGGGLPWTLKGGVGPGEWAGMNLPGSSIRAGAYAARITSDHFVGAISRTDWPSVLATSMVESTSPSRVVVVPGVSNSNAFGCSLLSVQNADDVESVEAVIEIKPASGGDDLLQRIYPILPGASITLRLCDDDDLVASLPPDFVGWARIYADDVNQSLVVQVTQDFPTSITAVAGYMGVPEELVRDVLFAPAVHSYWPPAGFDRIFDNANGAHLWSRLMVVNPTYSDVSVTALYTGIRGDCLGHTFEQGPVVVPARGQAVLAPAEDGTLPSKCLTAGRLESTGRGVIAVVVDRGIWRLPPTSSPTPSPTPLTTPAHTATETAPVQTDTPETTPTPAANLLLPFAERSNASRRR